MKPVMKIYNVINIIHIKHLVYSLVHSKCSIESIIIIIVIIFISFSLGCLLRVKSVVSDSLRPHQVPLSMGFSRQENWSGLPCLYPGDLPDPGIELMSLNFLH